MEVKKDQESVAAGGVEPGEGEDGLCEVRPGLSKALFSFLPQKFSSIPSNLWTHV